MLGRNAWLCIPRCATRSALVRFRSVALIRHYSTPLLKHTLKEGRSQQAQRQQGSHPTILHNSLDLRTTKSYTATCTHGGDRSQRIRPVAADLHGFRIGGSQGWPRHPGSLPAVSSSIRLSHPSGPFGSPVERPSIGPHTTMVEMVRGPRAECNEKVEENLYFS